MCLQGVGKGHTIVSYLFANRSRASENRSAESRSSRLETLETSELDLCVKADFVIDLLALPVFGVRATLDETDDGLRDQRCFFEDDMKLFL